MARKADPGKRDSIIEAAINVFAQKGYAGTRILEVAREAGIGKGTIYEYFRSKEDLFFATFEQLMTQSQKLLEHLPDEGADTAADRLHAIADTLLAAWQSNIEFYGLTLEFWSATTSLPGRKRFQDALKKAYAEFRMFLVDVIEQGVASGEFAPVTAQNLASVLMGSWDALLLQAWLDPKFDPLAASKTHMNVLIKGLAR